MLHELWDDPEDEGRYRSALRQAGDLQSQLRASKIADWRDVSDKWESSPYRRYVQEALALPEGWDE